VLTVLLRAAKGGREMAHGMEAALPFLNQKTPSFLLLSWNLFGHAISP